MPEGKDIYDWSPPTAGKIAARLRPGAPGLRRVKLQIGTANGRCREAALECGEPFPVGWNLRSPLSLPPTTVKAVSHTGFRCASTGDRTPKRLRRERQERLRAGWDFTRRGGHPARGPGLTPLPASHIGRGGTTPCLSDPSGFRLRPSGYGGQVGGWNRRAGPIRRGKQDRFSIWMAIVPPKASSASVAGFIVDTVYKDW